MNTSFLQGNSSAFYTMDGKVCLTSSLETNETAYCKCFHWDNFSLIIKAKELGGGGGGKLKTRVYWVKNANWFSRLYYRKFTPSYITSRDGIWLTAMSIVSLLAFEQAAILLLDKSSENISSHLSHLCWYYPWSISLFIGCSWSVIKRVTK